MKFEREKCPECGEPLIGTCDTVPGIAKMFKDDEEEWTYTGDTEVLWDGQMTEKDEEGRVRVQCTAGHDWYTEAEDA